MQFTLALLALVGAAAAAPQGVTAVIAPSATAPAGCSPTYAGAFNIEVVNASTVPNKAKRADPLTVTLAGGVLTDSAGRTGSIVANFQFQFDKPAQNGAIYTGGFSACSNGSLALGGSNVFYQCLSGDFYNLYDRSWAQQCSPILIQIIPVASNTTTTGVVTATTTASMMAGSLVGTLADGQPTASTAASFSSSTAVVSQITDGQVQATTAASFSSTPTSTTTKTVVTQISDGQIQATSAASYSRTTTAAPVMFTGAANILSYANGMIAVAAGAAAVAML